MGIETRTTVGVGQRASVPIRALRRKENVNGWRTAAREGPDPTGRPALMQSERGEPASG